MMSALAMRKALKSSAFVDLQALLLDPGVPIHITCVKALTTAAMFMRLIAATQMRPESRP